MRHAAEDVERLLRLADLTVGEVLPVVVDGVRDPLLHPGGGGLHQPAVLGEVVAELDGVEELVGSGDPEAVDRGRAELGAGEVVVEHAVARRLPLPPGLAALGCAVAVDAGADLLEVDVQLRVAAPAAVRDRLAVVEGADLLGPDLVEHLEVGVDPGAARRLRQRPW